MYRFFRFFAPTRLTTSAVLFYPVRSTVSNPSQLSMLTLARLLIEEELLYVMLKVFNSGHCEMSTVLIDAGIVKLEIIPRLDNLMLSNLSQPEMSIFSKKA
jgi:hypothetical protein